MVVGICQISLIIPGATSLKDKRQVLKSLVARVKSSFNVSVSEVGQNDLWQNSVIGLTVSGNDAKFVNSTLDNIIDFIEALKTVEIIRHDIEIVNYKGE